MTEHTVSPTSAIAADRELDFRPGMDMRWEITKSTADTNGDYFETVNWAGPESSGPPVHVHPSAEETYAVLEGRLDVFVGDHWRTLTEGESITVPAGTPHTLDNRSGEPLVLVNTHRPAMRFEEMFRDFNALIRDGKLTLPPNGPRSAIFAGMFFAKYSEEQRVTKPPHLLFKALSLIGHALGFRLTVPQRP